MGLDVLQHLTSPASLPFDRIAQHSILFVYPLLWVPVGYWLSKVTSTGARGLLLSLTAVNAYPNLFGANVVNLSLGPLLIVPCVWMAGRSIYTTTSNHRYLWLLGSILCGVFTYYPFILMWGFTEQRTSLLILIVSLVWLPFAAAPSRQWLRALGFSSLLLLLLFGGICAKSYSIAHAHPSSVEHNLQPQTAIPLPYGPPVVMHRATLKKRLISDALQSLQKPEDRPNTGHPGIFQSRTRRYMWSSALSQWKFNPMTGVRFIPEVPSALEDNIVNNGGFEKVGAPPVNGAHNSYITVLARMGLIGMGLFFLLLASIMRHSWRLMRLHLDEFWPFILGTLIANGLIHSLFNVGFESPHKSVIFWIAAGMIVGFDQGSFP